MHFIPREIKKLLKKYKTNDPFILAEKLNIHVHIMYLHEDINGFYKLEEKNRFIIINKNLSEEMQRFVCAHELGHAILHKEVNTSFFRKYTLFSVDKVEVQAHTFAVELLLLTEDVTHCLSCGYTIYDIAKSFGIPKEVVHLKKF